MDLFTARRLDKIMAGYIALKVPPNVRDSVRLIYERAYNCLTLSEERPTGRQREWSRSAIAQFRMEQGRWEVYAQDAAGGWMAVAGISPHADFERQLEQVELDREGRFWIS